MPSIYGASKVPNFIHAQGHGAGCCGIQSYKFGYGRLESRAKKDLDDLVKSHDRLRVLAELTLTESQLDQHSPWLKQHLKKLGFKCVSRFVNGNSGNTVNIFHYHPARKRFTWGN